MNVSRAAAMAAVLGGLVWLVAAVLDWGQDVNPIVYTIGLVWFLVALMGLGYGLVEKAPVWLQLGDFGHSRGGSHANDQGKLNAQGLAFFNTYLKGKKGARVAAGCGVGRDPAARVRRVVHDQRRLHLELPAGAGGRTAAGRHRGRGAGAKPELGTGRGAGARPARGPLTSHAE